MQGNVEFTECEEEEGVTVSDPAIINIISTLLAVTPGQLEEALCFRTIASRKDVFAKRHSSDVALYSRDAFAKVLNNINMSPVWRLTTTICIS